MPKFPESGDAELKRLSLISDAIERPYRLKSVVGSPFTRNGFYGLSLVYYDRVNETEKAITLFCGPDELEDLGRLIADGIDWFDDEEAQAESERLQKDAMNPRTDYN